MTVKIEFQNINLKHEDKIVLENLSEEFNVILKIRSSKSLSGVESLLIGISGRIIGDYLLRLFKFVEEKYKSKYKIQVRNEDNGETVDLDEAKKDLNEKEAE